MPLKIPTIQTGLEQSIQKAVRNVSARGGLNLKINDREFTRPLGKITGSISEFNKSLEASNARVIAFGASVGIITGMQRAFASLIKTTAEVEQKLTEINVVMSLTNKQLQQFSTGLFKIAKNTAQSFSTVATAATELARQGLSMEETLRRTNDALILTRLTGLDAANAVSGLTAAINTFNKSGLDSTKILSKMAAVDVQFAVSTEDLIDAVSRAGAVAQDAGVSFDQLLGAVTAAQQMTARGGKVIGNSFKTIFTRVQRSSTIQRLEELGIAVRDISGNTLPAITVLENLAKTYDKLADTTKAAVAEQVGGVFQINILKASIKDLAEQNSILARATQIAGQATDEAYKKNEILNKSLSALTSQTASSIKELSSLIGELGFSDALKDYLTVFRDRINDLSNLLGQQDGESMGGDVAKGFIAGFGKAITGPGLVLAIAILGKLFIKTFSFLKGSTQEILGVVSASKQQKQIQESIVAVLTENSSLQKKLLSQEGNRAAQEKTILSILQAQAREQQKIAAAAASVAPAIFKSGFDASLRKRTRSTGHIPNFVSSSEKEVERMGAIQGGYSPGRVTSMTVPGAGRVVYNTAEKVQKFAGMQQPAIIPPKNSKAGKNYKKEFTVKHGFNPYASKGLVPKSRWGGNVSQMNDDQRRMHEHLEEQAAREREIARGAHSRYSRNKALKSSDKKNTAMVFGDLSPQLYEKALNMYYNPTSYYRRPGKTIPPQLFQNTIIPSTMLESLQSKRPMPFIPNLAYRPTPQNIAAGLIYGKKRATGLSLGDGRTLSDSWHSFSAAMRTGGELNSLRTLIHRKFLKNASPSFLKKVEDSLGTYGNTIPESWRMSPGGSGLLDGMIYDLNLSRANARNIKIKDLGDRKLEIPNYSAFSFDKNLNSSKIVEKTIQLMSDFPKRKGVFDPNLEDKRLLNNTNVLSYLDKNSLSTILKTFIKNADSSVFDFKGSYAGIPINQYKSLFQGDSTYGMRNISSTRMREILSNPGVFNSFYSYLTGKSSSINIGSGLNSSEKKFFKDTYGAIPSVKHAEDGFSKTRADNLSLLREDFFETKGVERQVRDFTKRMTRMSPSGDYPRIESLLKTNEFLGLLGKSSSIYNKPKSQQLLLGHNPQKWQQLLLSHDPERWITKARPGDSQRAQLYNWMKSFTPSKSTSSMTGKPGYFGELSGRFRGDQVGIRSAVIDTASVNRSSAMSRGRMGAASRLLNRTFGPQLFEKALKEQKYNTDYNAAEKLFRTSPSDAFTRMLQKEANKASKKFGFGLFGSEGLVPNFSFLRKRKTGLSLNAKELPSITTTSKGARIRKSDDFDGVIGLSALDEYLKKKTFSSINYTSKKGKNSIFTKARWGVNQYKEGATPPGDYVSWGQLDKSTGTRALWVGSVGSPDDPGKTKFRRLKLQNVNSIVTAGKHFKVDPNIAASGLIPNYSLFSGQARDILSKNPGYQGAVADAISREASFGLTPKVVSAPSLKSSKNPGLAVVNQEQESGSLAKARMLHGGLNPNQKSSMPNYAVGLGDLLGIRYDAKQQIRTTGLNMMERSFMEARSAIDLFSANTKKGAQYLNQFATRYAKTANIIKEANLRESARLGLMKKESDERKAFARQFFRQDAMQSIAAQGGAVGRLAGQFAGMGPREMEQALLTQRGIAMKAIGSGTNVKENKETLKALNKLEKALDKSAVRAMNAPATIARQIEKSFAQNQRFEKDQAKFSGTKGFNQQQARIFYGQQFLSQRSGGKDFGKKETSAILSKLGKKSQKEFLQFMQSSGVMSSNKALARAGLRTGEFQGLIKKGTNATPFISNLSQYQSMIKSGDTKGAKKLEKQLQRQAIMMGRGPEGMSGLSGLIAASKEGGFSKKEAKEAKRQQKEAAKRLRQGQNFRGSLMSAFRGGDLRAPGFSGRIGGALGAAGSKVGAGAKNFATSGLRNFGGTVGLSASFLLPMLGGFLQNNKPREERATFNQQTGSFQVQDRKGDVAADVATMAGMGALFGLPGLIIGAATGYINSMKKATLSIDEQIRVREKEIAIIGQNIQATQNIQNLSNARADALKSGDRNRVNEIDAMINQNLASITDKDALSKIAASGGDSNTISKIQKELQDQMTIQASGQNFAMAIKSNNVKNAGVAMGAMIAQGIRNKDVSEDIAINVLKDIQDSVGAQRKKGQLLSPEEMNALRVRAEGRQGLSGKTLQGAGVGAGAAGLGLGIAALAGVATGGLALPILALGATIGGIGFNAMETSDAQDKLENMQALGRDEIKAFDKLVEAGVLTEFAVQQMISSFKEGRMGIDELAKEAEDSVVKFNKVSEASDRAASRLFDLTKTISDAITNLQISSEIQKIQGQANISAKQSRDAFSARFMSPQNAANFLAKSQSDVFNMQAGLKIQQFNDLGNINFIQEVNKIKDTLTGITPPLLESITKQVAKEGTGGISQSLARRQIDTTARINISNKDLTKLQEIVGPGGENIGDANREDVASILGGERDIDQQRKIVSKIFEDIAKVSEQGYVEFQYVKDIVSQDAEKLEKILENNAKRATILEAQLQAEKKSLDLQVLQNNIQAKIQRDLDLISAQSKNNALGVETRLINQRSQAESKISALNFQQSDLFRGMRGDPQEMDRVDQLRKKAFDEEMKLKRAEDFEAFKLEAERLLTEKNLIDALNNLGDVIQAEQEKITGKTEKIPVSPLNTVPTTQKSNLKVPKGAEISDRQKELQSVLETARARKSELAAEKATLDNTSDVQKTRIQNLNSILAEIKDVRSADDKGFREAKARNIRNVLESKDFGRTDFTKTKKEVYTGPMVDWTGSARTNKSNYETQEFPASLAEMQTRIEEAIGETKTEKSKIDQSIADLNAEILKSSNKITETRNQIDGITQSIAKTNQSDTIQKIAEPLKSVDTDLSKINLEITNGVLKKVRAAKNIEDALKIINDAINSTATDGNVDQVLLEQANSLKAFQGRQNAETSARQRMFFAEQAQRNVGKFNSTLNFNQYSQGSMEQFRKIRNIDARAMGASNAFERAVEQESRIKNFQAIMSDSGSTQLERAQANQQLQSFTFGTEKQRKNFSDSIDKMASKNAELFEIESQIAEKKASGGTAQEVFNLEQKGMELRSEISKLNESMQKLTERMERTTPRDKGFESEFSTNMTAGLKTGFASVQDDAEHIYTRLGNDLPIAFRDGLTDAMMSAINGAQKFEDAMRQVGMTLLKSIQQAFLQSAASRITGAIGGLFNLQMKNTGGMVSGGSGVRDDVPALLTGGEYVIKKSSVQKYGTNFLDNLNSGQLPGYNSGGAVISIGSPRVGKRESYEDTNQDGNVTRYKKLEKDIGISRMLSGYAIANDRAIQKYFRDQQKEFGEDLQTKAQEKQRAKNKAYRSEVEKAQRKGAIISILGSAVFAKGFDYLKGKYQETDFYKNRQQKKIQQQFDKKGYADVKGKSLMEKYPDPADRRTARQFLQKTYDREGPMATARLMSESNLGGQVDEFGFELFRRNKGGSVPTMLTGGEYVMSPETVKAVGTDTMAKINSGSLNTGNRVANNNNISHGDVNISINVDNSGSVSSQTNPLATKEFASKVKAAVLDVIAREKRVGGKLR